MAKFKRKVLCVFSELLSLFLWILIQGPLRLHPSNFTVHFFLSAFFFTFFLFSAFVTANLHSSAGYTHIDQNGRSSEAESGFM